MIGPEYHTMSEDMFTTEDITSTVDAEVTDRETLTRSRLRLHALRLGWPQTDKTRQEKPIGTRLASNLRGLHWHKHDFFCGNKCCCLQGKIFLNFFQNVFAFTLNIPFTPWGEEEIIFGNIV